ncbi:hypothetical protein SCLCIDRAFT_1216011 [Scleroderma citrinum Foug A]|uniref:Uncharacterized protein n=1 Tax=Scleroderma citrinum Foug A TaxID=1036808 RepID=A0A0C2ZIT3_9AGAM|nr:hypothetical protein SCLCIDRAFT_1216011 [Scleroderma citrinum Foug A]
MITSHQKGAPPAATACLFFILEVRAQFITFAKKLVRSSDQLHLARLDSGRK